MKSLIAFACLAVASVATAAELKNPDLLAAEWARTIWQANIDIRAHSLSTQSGPPITTVNPAIAESDPAPAYRFPEIKGSTPSPKMRPRENAKPDSRAKEWKFRGESYWIVPLTS